MAATKQAAATIIPRSPRAFWYHLGYFFTRSVKNLLFWVIFVTVAITAFRLIRSAKAFGISDAEIAQAFLEPFNIVLPVFFGSILLYAIIRGIISTLTTRYNLTPQGILLETGWWTKRTVIVSYDQIQKMTIVANPYDRMLRSSYIYLDLIGGGYGISLEAVDAKAVGDLQKKLTGSSAPRLSTKSAPKKLTSSKPAQKKTATKKKATQSLKRKSRRSSTKQPAASGAQS